MLLVFFQNAFLCFSSKTDSEVYREKLTTENFPRNVLNGNYKVTFSYKKSRLDTVGRLGLEGLLLTHVSQLIV